jgi:hypothetical protein
MKAALLYLFTLAFYPFAFVYAWPATNLSAMPFMQ